MTGDMRAFAHVLLVLKAKRDMVALWIFLVDAVNGRGRMDICARNSVSNALDFRRLISSIPDEDSARVNVLSSGSLVC